MTSHQRQHPLGFLLPEPGATFDIGKEKCDGVFRHASYTEAKAD